MRKNPFIRWQLWALGGITLLLLYRVMEGPPPREGLVVLERMEPLSVHYRSFEVERSIRVSIEGTGSFENLEPGNASMAAYAWIINTDTREPVWQMGGSNATRAKGTLAEVRDDLKLEAGTYQLFFAAYGNQMRGRLNRSSREEAEWEEDRREWYVVLNLIEGKETDVRSVHFDEDENRYYANERLVWQSGSVTNQTTKDFLFNVNEQTPFHIRGTGEFSEDQHDFGFVENLITGSKVWEMTMANTTPAGGVVENRKASEEILLAPGIYRVAYQTDATHSYDNWNGNPPFDPMGWGLVLTTPDTSEPIMAFDPWDAHQPIIAMMPNGDDQFKATTFRLTRKQRVILYGMGELKGNDRYDFGWIERMRASSRSSADRNHDDSDRYPDADLSVWEMNYEDSSPAGGDDTNRRTLDFIDLMPDVYTMYYRTDGSHSFDDWSNGEPANGNRWGLALFALDVTGGRDFQILERLDLSDVEEYEEVDIEDRYEEHIAAIPAAPQAPRVPTSLNFDPSDILISLNKLGNRVEMSEKMVLQGWSQLRIISAGEITISGNRYDYGYITKGSNGEVVWEMTLENTQPAGGDESNRIFDGTIGLAAGEYEVHFNTDATHAFGDFNTTPPSMPEAWGITIARTE